MSNVTEFARLNRRKAAAYSSVQKENTKLRGQVSGLLKERKRLLAEWRLGAKKVQDLQVAAKNKERKVKGRSVRTARKDSDDEDEDGGESVFSILSNKLKYH